ncbi:unnamed protein product, partial [Amoebophrya sp. A120]|eukprot:GSA120T00015597001.1
MGWIGRARDFPTAPPYGVGAAGSDEAKRRTEVAKVKLADRTRRRFARRRAVPSRVAVPLGRPVEVQRPKRATRRQNKRNQRGGRRAPAPWAFRFISGAGAGPPSSMHARAPLPAGAF